jgi:hypothetical protein
VATSFQPPWLPNDSRSYAGAVTDECGPRPIHACHHHGVRSRGVLLVLYGFAAFVHVSGVLVGSESLAWQGGLAAFLLLAGVVVTRDGPPGVRWWLVAAALALAAVVVASFAPFESSSESLSFTSYGPGDLPAELRQAIDASLDLQRWLAFGLFVGAGCIGAAALALPPRRRPRAAVVVAVVGLFMLVHAVLRVWDKVDCTPGQCHPRVGPGEVIAAVWLPLLAAAVAVAAAMIAVQRAAVGWLAATGALLLALPALQVAVGAAWTLPLWPFGDTNPLLSLGYLDVVISTAAMVAGPVCVALAYLPRAERG